MRDAKRAAGHGRGEQPAELSISDDRELTVAEVITLANQLQQQERLDEAEEIYRTVLRAVPGHPDAANFLGVLLHKRGQSDEGIRWVQEAIAAAPRYTDAHFNLGSILHQSDRPEEALAAFARARECDSRFLNAYFQAANVLFSLDRRAEALEMLAHAVEIEPDAVGVYKRFGLGLRAAGRVEDAAEVFRAWLQCDPQNPTAQHLFQACAGAETPERASDGFVRQEFDGFAETFDEKLRKLDYRAPELVTAAVEREYGAPAGRLDLLDAGCGTGLCGPLVKPWTRRLVGIDLSDGMLAKARDRGVYDELVAGELTGFLLTRQAAFDLIIAADVLVYFGDLGPVLAAARSALRPGGRLIATVEEFADDGPDLGYRLSPSGRYCHREAYLRQVLTETGYTCTRVDRATLRAERKQPVAGLVFTAVA